MAVIKINLLKNKYKPTINLTIGKQRLDALIDTGAHIPVWNICFKDNYSEERFYIHNVPLAIDDSRDYGYDIILSSTLFDKVNYGFQNKETPRYFYIDYDRDIFCLNKAILVNNDYEQKIPLKNSEGRIILKDVVTFFQD